jgi:WD40 repeat protein
VLSVALTPHGDWVLSGSKDRGVQFWDPHTGVAQLMLQGHKNSGMLRDILVWWFYANFLQSSQWLLVRLAVSLRRAVATCAHVSGGKLSSTLAYPGAYN